MDMRGHREVTLPTRISWQSEVGDLKDSKIILKILKKYKITIIYENFCFSLAA